MKSAIGVLAVHGVFWAYPLAEGGLANVLGMAAWMIACLFVIIMLWAVLADPELKEAGLPAWAKAITRASMLALVVWLAWWGHIALALLLALVVGLAALKRSMNKEGAA